MNIDKRIGEIEEILQDNDWDRLYELGFSGAEEIAEWLFDRLKTCREELSKAKKIIIERQFDEQS